MRRSLKLFWDYFKLTYLRWWWGLYTSVIGSYELASRLIPQTVLRMPPLSSQALFWLAVPLFLLAPFPVFLKLQKQLKEAMRFNRRTALTVELDLKFGEVSYLTLDARMTLATAYFEGLEREVLAGNFTHAIEVLVLKDIMLPTLKGYFGTAGAVYASWHERLVRVVEAVTRHEEELRE